MFVLNGLTKLLQPIFDLIYIVLEFIYYLGVIIVKIVLLVFTIGKLLVGLIAGLFSTIIGFSYTGSGASTALPSSYLKVIDHIRPALAILQVDKIAYLLQFTLWLFTAFMAIRIAGNMRGGGGVE